MAAFIASPSLEATFTVPSSSMLILAPVFSTISRITLPPVPITSRILSVAILKVYTRGGQRLGHLAEDVDASVPGLAERNPHDLFGDALDLDVHLQRGDAVIGAGDLEVHVAEMILIAED